MIRMAALVLLLIPSALAADPVRHAPTEVQLGEKTVKLRVTAWRNLMPGGEQPLIITFSVAERAAGQPAEAIPVDARRLWLLREQHVVWQGRPRQQGDAGPPGTAWRVDDGPKLRRGTVLDVVVELRYGRKVLYLKAQGVSVGAAS
jgi:hypothetical protein